MDDIEKVLLEKGIDIAADFIKSIVKPGAIQIGELFADKVKFWRLKNQVDMLVLAQEYVNKTQAEVHSVQTKNLIKILDYSSLEDDEYMQYKWAALLIDAAKSKGKFNSNHLYVELLAQLSSIEVMILDELMKAFKETGYIHSVDGYSFNQEFLFKYNISTSLGLTTDVSDVIYDNLFRLNLIKYGNAPLTHGNNRYVDHERVAFTKLGEGFISACLMDEDD